MEIKSFEEAAADFETDTCEEDAFEATNPPPLPTSSHKVENEDTNGRPVIAADKASNGASIDHADEATTKAVRDEKVPDETSDEAVKEEPIDKIETEVSECAAIDTPNKVADKTVSETGTATKSSREVPEKASFLDRLFGRRRRPSASSVTEQYDTSDGVEDRPEVDSIVETRWDLVNDEFKRKQGIVLDEERGMGSLPGCA